MSHFSPNDNKFVSNYKPFRSGKVHTYLILHNPLPLCRPFMIVVTWLGRCFWSRVWTWVHRDIAHISTWASPSMSYPWLLPVSKIDNVICSGCSTPMNTLCPFCYRTAFALLTIAANKATFLIHWDSGIQDSVFPDENRVQGVGWLDYEGVCTNATVGQVLLWTACVRDVHNITWCWITNQRPATSISSQPRSVCPDPARAGFHWGSNFKVQLWHMMLKPSVSHKHVTFWLRKVLHRCTCAAQVSQLTNVAASQNKYTHISVNKIDKNMKILEPIDMIKRHGILC